MFGSNHELHNPKDQWYPYGSKIMSLLDILFNSPGLCISSAQMNMFLWVLKKTNVPGTPSLYEFMKNHGTLWHCNSVVTHQLKSAHGNNYYQSNNRAIIAQHCYVGELVQLKTNELVLPIHWIIFQDESAVSRLEQIFCHALLQGHLKVAEFPQS
ncbi:hypothetical protein BC835DRAFT_1472693 [Cytidiella melzeri]|nr:hypothetical protein BC835DRAFT_1472693 [Cytidiella melzeri]